MDIKILKGLTSGDRTPEEQKAVDNVMGYKEESPSPISITTDPPTTNRLTIQQEQAIKDSINKSKMADSLFRESLPIESTRPSNFADLEYDKKQHELAGFGKGEEYARDLRRKFNEELKHKAMFSKFVDMDKREKMQAIAGEVSSYYKKFKDTDKLPISGEEWQMLADGYDAKAQVYGEDVANRWLDRLMKDRVAENQSWWEQGVNAIGHIIPAIEGSIISTAGHVYGTLAPLLIPGAPMPGLDKNPDLGFFKNYIDNIIDNPITRYGNDVEKAGASHVGEAIEWLSSPITGIDVEWAPEKIKNMKETATYLNPEGIANDAIITTDEQDRSYFNSATPWKALQSGGFTAASMLIGAGEAKAATWLFGNLRKGIEASKVFRTVEGVEKALNNIKRAENFTDRVVIPGLVGSMEGAIEGLNTKIQVENEGTQQLDTFYKEKVTAEAEALYQQRLKAWEDAPLIMTDTESGRKMSKGKMPTYEDTFQEVWFKYAPEYEESRRQIEWAASTAGVQNFFTNSLINGLINQTLKSGIHSPKVQESLRNSKMWGWAYRKPKFDINDNVPTPKTSKRGLIGKILKEPFGEALEEYEQNLSGDTFSGAAESNIQSFIDNKFNSDGTAKVGDVFGDELGAAWTAFRGSLTSRESIESAILGAVSSTMGTFSGVKRGYKRNAEGKLVRDNNIFRRGLTQEGEKETWTDYFRRITPWRSGAMNAYFDYKDEQKEAKRMAASLTEWLSDPKNREKWDGLQGTANWMTQMENASESNDQFSYRKAQMGKAINDAFMLSSLEGTDFYDTIIKDLQKSASMDVTAEETKEMVEKIRANGGETAQNMTDEEIVDQIKSNANKMLGLLSTVEKEGRSLDRLLGRIDNDTKQSLIFGKIMEKDYKERKAQLEDEINNIKSQIQSSTKSSGGEIDDDLKNLIIKFGSVNQALKAQSYFIEQKEKLEKEIQEIEAIDSEKRTDKQNQTVTDNKKKVKGINNTLKSFDALYKKDEKGKKTNEVDSSLASLVLNEEEIMNLDPVTRAIVLKMGASKMYNALHQNREKVDQLNLEIDEINSQIQELEDKKANWETSEGKVKKHHNKQHSKVSKQIEELNKKKASKMRALDNEQHKFGTKQIYSDAQQAVIDNLVQQGMAQDPDFLDKVVDMGRLEQGIKQYHSDYQAILLDPKAFHNYVQRAKANAAEDLVRRRAERVANIEDFEEYSKELYGLTANASEEETKIIMQTLRNENARRKRRMAADAQDEKVANWKGEEDGQLVQDEKGNVSVQNAEINLPETNYDRFMRNLLQQGELVDQFAKNPNLTDNDRSILIDAMQYLAGKGIDVSNREAAVEALIEEDEQGNLGGKFRQWIEEINDRRLPQQRTVFTSTGQVVGQYVDLLNGQLEDHINRGNITPTITLGEPQAQPEAPAAPAPAPAPNPEGVGPASPAQQGPSLFNIGGSTPEAGHFVDGDGTVATGAQTNAAKNAQQQAPEEPKTEIEERFKNVASPEIAKILNTVETIIQGSNVSDEAKALAWQYFNEMAVSNERLNTIDDVLDVLQEQIERLNNQSNMQEEDKNQFSEAAGVLRKFYSTLVAKKSRGRQRTVAPAPTRPENPNAAMIHTANIPYMQSRRPDSWAVTFTDTHDIDNWNLSHNIDLDEPVYFITDSEWTAQVTSQMNGTEDSRNYDTLTDMPIIAAVRVETPSNPSTTTAIEVDGLWYQPIGVMPSSKALTSGAALTQEIRKRANKEQGRHLVTADGTPNGSPLITHVFGVNYLTAHHPDAVSDTQRNNSEENNSQVLDVILNDLPVETRDRLKAMSQEEMLKDPEYQAAKVAFLNGLSWVGEDGGALKNQVVFTPNRHRDSGTASPILVKARPMAQTTGKTTGIPLLDVLKSGSGEDLVNFNSRTERLYNEIIRPLYQYLPLKDRSGDKSAKVITQSDLEGNPNAYTDKAERLTKLLNGYDGRVETQGIKGISDFIFIKPGSGWSIVVTAPEAGQTAGENIASSETVYKVLLRNVDPATSSIVIGEIKAGKNDTNAATELLRNLMFDKETGEIRNFLNWQVSKQDVINLNNAESSKAARPRQNIGAMIDDGIFEMAGTSARYDVDGVKLRSPIAVNEQGHSRVLYPQDKTSNSDNAQAPAPVNQTPQAQGTVAANDGSQVQTDSGIVVDNPPSQPSTPEKSDKLRKAEEVTRKIIEDSKQFVLSEDETHYYITDKVTGKETRYLRVTTVIGADESVEQWEPSLDNIINKLKEQFAIPELSQEQISQIKDTPSMAKILNVSESAVKRAVAELRTRHKKEKYGAWATPSTSIGNTVDQITRDFFANNLKEEYPNVTKDAVDKFVQQLTLLKSNLEGRDINIVSEGVMAHGKITMTDTNGNRRDVNVAGTLDLFGYDDNGNFYIFDMKTTRNHSAQKLQAEKDKWSRQISMYADLLKQTYGIDISPNNLKIIPINIDYPTPMGSRSDYLDPAGPQYTEDQNGQLQMNYRGHADTIEFKDSNPEMRNTTFEGQFKPGYTKLNINWDNLSSEDQDIADNLVEQAAPVDDAVDNVSPQSATVETPQPQRPSFIAADSYLEDYSDDWGGQPSHQAPPVTQNGETSTLPEWRLLGSEAQKYLIERGYVDQGETMREQLENYNDFLNDPASVEEARKDMKCRGLI